MHFYLIMHHISFLFMYLHSLFNVTCILSLSGYYHLELLFFSSFFYSWTVWFKFEICFHNKHSEKGLIWRMTFHTRIIPIPDVWLVILGLSSLLIKLRFFIINKDEKELIWRMTFHTPDGSYPWRMTRDFGTILILIKC